MLNLLMKRRSIRKYKEKPIEKKTLDKILQGALTSPSSKSRRPWELVVIEDKGGLEKLGDSRGSHSRPISNAPLAIVVAADPRKSDVYVEDCSIIALAIQLMAESEGLGSCWIQVRNRTTPWDESVEDYIKGILDIPGDYIVECVIALGYSDETKKSHNIVDLPYNKIHYDKFK
ncbi:MAG TPA: nitroreductase family protein [Anaerovoracaceae bacterium]|nr:nitroreductase family protein [Anaerovoracaceae bacterium]